MVPEGMLEVNEIEPAELWRLLNDGRELCLLDVRQSEELAYAHLEGVVHIPLGELEQRIAEVSQLAKHSAVKHIVLCRAGVRSAKAIKLFEGYEMPMWFNLRGGINALARETDCGLSQY